MDKKDAIKILKQQREYWGFEISDSEKSPHPVLRKDLCAALDVAIEELQKES